MAGANVVRMTTTIKGITTIALNRPNCRNAVDLATAKLLYDSFIKYEDDPSQRVCIFHGMNGTFCAGYDLKSVGHNQGLPAEPFPLDQARSRGPMGPSRLSVSKPVICAVSGYAVAGGLELSLLGDVRIVEEDAIFGVFCRRWGVPLIDGGTVRLQKIVGLGRALDMILTGRPVDAKEALAMGLANRVVPKGQALQEAWNMARQLIDFPQECMIADRKSAYHAAYDANSFDDALDYEYKHGIEIVAKEGAAGAARFAAGAGRHGSFTSSDKAKL